MFRYLLTFYFSHARTKFLDDMIRRSAQRRHARSFNLCYRYIDDLIVFNKKFVDYLKAIYPS